jgi:hypothetical protein
MTLPKRPMPKRPMSESMLSWSSPTVVLAIAAFGLTAWNTYQATQTSRADTQTGYEVRIAKLELRVEMLERKP